MNSLNFKIKSFAKLNLFLHIVGYDENYKLHQLQSLFRKFDLHDLLEVEFDSFLLDHLVKFTYEDNRYLSCGEYIDEKNNLVIKAINFFSLYTGLKLEKMRIKVHKKIPIGAGLGGGSSNAAYILDFLFNYYNIKFEDCLYSKITQELGSDVSYFLLSKQELPNKILILDGAGHEFIAEDVDVVISGLKVLVIFPNEFFCTKSMFGRYRRLFNKFTERIAHDEFSDWSFEKNFNNDFMKCLTTEQFELTNLIIEQIKLQKGCMLANLSGSGSACFGVFFSDIELEKALINLQNVFGFGFWYYAGELL